MKQNGKVRGARGVKTDARSTAAGILKAARRHGALGVVRQPGHGLHLGARPFCERDALHAVPHLAAAPKRWACPLQDRAMAAAAGRSGGAGATAGLMSWEDGELNLNLPGFCRHRDKVVG